MFPLSLVTWWYSTGWRDQAELLNARLSRVSDRFSIGLLLRSLFSPFRQISADGGGPSFDAKLRAWVDKTVSRCIGAMIRSAIIVVGGLAFLLEITIGVVRLIVWPLLPILPFAGLSLAISGWVPL